MYLLYNKIHTGRRVRICQPVRRVLPPHRHEMERLLQEMQDKNVSQKSAIPWAALIVLVKKEDGTTRFYIDYWKLNHVTSKNAYPLPRINSTLDLVTGNKWFSTLELLSGYWQIEVADEDRQKTAFNTTEGLFEFKVMPFGLCNAPATF